VTFSVQACRRTCVQDARRHLRSDGASIPGVRRCTAVPRGLQVASTEASRHPVATWCRALLQAAGNARRATRLRSTLWIPWKLERWIAGSEFEHINMESQGGGTGSFPRDVVGAAGSRAGVGFAEHGGAAPHAGGTRVRQLSDGAHATLMCVQQGFSGGSRPFFAACQVVVCLQVRAGYMRVHCARRELCERGRWDWLVCAAVACSCATTPRGSSTVLSVRCRVLSHALPVSLAVTHLSRAVIRVGTVRCVVSC
jgi:hypothetical protein